MSLWTDKAGPLVSTGDDGGEWDGMKISVLKEQVSSDVWGRSRP